MDFWARLIGSTAVPKKAAPKSVANDSQARLGRFQRVYKTVLDLCNRPRNLGAEETLLDNLRVCLDRLAAFVREETRAPVPHSCIHFAARNQIYTVIARAATVSQYEPVVRSTIAVFAALVDSEEENFLSSAPFAKSLMRLVSRVVDSGNVLISLDTETAILELLFNVAAKIRLDPEILPVWFQSTAKPELEDIYVREEKKSFVGITQKDDFPLCYLLIDRVHHDGRIGDFARTGLLYIFEVTGHSSNLEQWVVSSDLPTLMASGLGALYSQLSRELSILHPDATLPAVLAMSDYATTHPRANAESAFSGRYLSHMATFLSYLAFWQDVLDHCRSADVKATLLDHFQILFLQQLLYPSLLQSSDTDAGSAVAVLTYLTAMIESLEYPDLIHMILAYLLALQADQAAAHTAGNSAISPAAPRSPTALKRRQSLMLLNAPKDPDTAVEPALFNLVDLIINNINSESSQPVFAALKLTSTILSRQRKYAFGTLLRAQKSAGAKDLKTVGMADVEVDRYSDLAISLHPHPGLDATYIHLCDDLRSLVESQVPLPTTAAERSAENHSTVNSYSIAPNDPLLRALLSLLETFMTNSVDVNLALTQVFITIALCIEIRLEDWALPRPSDYAFDDASSPLPPPPRRSWQSALESDEQAAWSAIHRARIRPSWPAAPQAAPPLYQTLSALCAALAPVRTAVPAFDHLLLGRKTMLQQTATSASAEGDAGDDNVSFSEAVGPSSSSPPAPAPASPRKSARNAGGGHSRQSSTSSTARQQPPRVSQAPSSPRAAAPPLTPWVETSPPTTTVARHSRGPESANPARRLLFQPPPPESPSTTDVLMEVFAFPRPNTRRPDDPVDDGDEGREAAAEKRTASLNHILTNVVVLQEFILEFVAVLQIRAAVLAEREVVCSAA